MRMAYEKCLLILMPVLSYFPFPSAQYRGRVKNTCLGVMRIKPWRFCSLILLLCYIIQSPYLPPSQLALHMLEWNINSTSSSTHIGNKDTFVTKDQNREVGGRCSHAKRNNGRHVCWVGRVVLGSNVIWNVNKAVSLFINKRFAVFTRRLHIHQS